MENCNCHNEIILKGSGQLERYLTALEPSYVSIDGRSFEDVLSFASGYADQIRFYDMPGSQVNDNTPAPKVSWVEFFKRDMAVIAASIASVNLEKIKSDYELTSEEILVNPTVQLYTNLFNHIVGIVKQIDQWFSIAIPENPLYTDINLAINSTLSTQLKKAIAYEEGFIVVDSKTVLNIDYTKVINKQEWGLNAAVNPEFDIYLGTTPEARILNAVPYVDDIFQSFYSVISNIVEQSTRYIDYALTQYPSHQPYMALYIAFLKLFGIAQDQMNGLTGRMLDFYYRDVLRLTEKPSIPDKVFLVFQLAQNVAKYDLPQGTPLSAGKDASGKDQIYKTENDFVVSQASVKEIKNLFIDQAPDTAKANKPTINALYANPVANSLDGNGAKFPIPNSKWPTFNPGLVSKAAPKNICESIERKRAELNPGNLANIGFAIASPQLVMQGGNRLVKCKMPLDFSKVDPKLLTNTTLQMSLTGEKGWLNISRQMSADEHTAIEKIMVDGGFPAPDATKGYLDKSGFLVDSETVDSITYGVIYIYLPIAEQGIIAFDAKLHTGNTYTTNYPVMQFLIGPDIGIPADLFNGLTISDVSIAVQVGSINIYNDSAQHYYPNMDGLKKLIIQNDIGTVTNGKPFDPYTTVPAFGMSFYIGSEEVFNKPLGQLTVNINKTNNSIGNTGYGYLKTAEFDATSARDYRVSVLNNKAWILLPSNTAGDDFTQQLLTLNIMYQLEPGIDGNILDALPLDRKPVERFTSYDINSDKGFLRLDNMATTSGADIQTRLNQASFLQIKEISISYLSTLSGLDSAIDQLFHIYPFGAVETFITTKKAAKGDKQKIMEQKPLMVDANNALLPQFTYLSPTSVYQDVVASQNTGYQAGIYNHLPQYSKGRVLDQLIYEASGLNEIIKGGNNQYSNTIQEEGLLFIGVEKLKPLQTLSLLFEFAPGSAIDEDGDLDAIKINWSYLVYNEWRPLNAENIISDSTYRFQTTGIIKLDVPADANDDHTIISNGLYWFCASVTTYSNRIPQLIDIIAQATEARFYDQDNSQSHYDNALPAGSISKLSVAVAEVKSVTQPFASFDGKHKEVGREYYIRVSERLRHKHRAITAWDYEHLVLDRFPGIFKVKCVANVDPGCLCLTPAASTHYTADKTGTAKCCGPVKSARNVVIVPVPNLKNDNAANPLQPKTSRLTLIEIVNYLSGLTSPFVKVHARNPVYEQVIVFFRVKFLSGTDKGYYLKKLNDEIVQYLTPWAFDQNIEADFGQKIYASAIINFIQQRNYVDFITDFLMGVCRDECCPADQTDLVTITADGFITALDQVSGCNDIEAFLKNQGYFIGDVIAEPSTQMSLLVSAPKHIILLYEDPIEQTPCEKRASALDRNIPTLGGNGTLIIKEEPAVEKETTAPAEAATPAVEAPNTGALANEQAVTDNVAATDTATADEKPTVIEGAIENIDKIFEKGKEAVKKAEDFLKNVVRGKSSDTAGEGTPQAQLDPGPDIKELPAASNQPPDSSKPQ
jgi:hypothetical protein